MLKRFGTGAFASEALQLGLGGAIQLAHLVLADGSAPDRVPVGIELQPSGRSLIHAHAAAPGEGHFLVPQAASTGEGSGPGRSHPAAQALRPAESPRGRPRALLADPRSASPLDCSGHRVRTDFSRRVTSTRVG